MRTPFLPLILCFGLAGTACSDSPVGPAAPDMAATVSGGQPWGPETQGVNLEVILRGEGFGLVKFRQPNDLEFRIYLDLWVRNLEPNTTYDLERAVDLDAPDGVCTSTSWLNLGSVQTDGTGTGTAALSRLIPASLDGIPFDIHFHVIRHADGAEVLASDCYLYTVSM